MLALNEGLAKALSVPSVERTLSLPLPRKRGREWMERVRGVDVMGTYNRAGVLETIATTVAERAPTRSQCSASASILETAAVGRLCLPRKREREQTVSVEKKQP